MSYEKRVRYDVRGELVYQQDEDGTWRWFINSDVGLVDLSTVFEDVCSDQHRSGTEVRLILESLP